MKLIVGLGNPGRKYEGTRHNIGFEVVRELARRHASGRPKTRFQGETCEAQIGRESVLLLMPQTFMNLSGSSVLPARDFYKLESEDILVVCDDFHLPLGRLRLRPGGSAGGQKGLADILRRLGTQSIPRLRLGIGAAPSHWDGADYVLGKFRKDERDAADEAVVRASDAAGEWVGRDIQKCMNKVNVDAAKVTPPTASKPAQSKPRPKIEPVTRIQTESESSESESKTKPEMTDPASESISKDDMANENKEL